MTCKVKNCRFPSTHTTLGHQCGKCGNFGHGVLECGNPKLVMNLLINNKDKLLKPHQYCQVVGCQFKEYHTTRGHKCEKCNRFHSNNECIIDNNMVKSLIDNKIDLLNCIPRNNYTVFYSGMGSKTYIKKNLQGVLSGIFMHSDSWGQYGKDTDDTPVLEKFLTKDFSQQIPFIKCPICRNNKNSFEFTNVIDNTENLDCSICLQNLKTKYVKLNKCSHIISCIDCFKKYIKS